MAASVRRAQDKGVVVGLKEATNEVRKRVDVDVLLKDEPDTFNLFLLANVMSNESEQVSTGCLASIGTMSKLTPSTNSEATVPMAY